ncbi:MAG: hypothetical protein ACHP7N_09120 [Caulobacterales bacterium]
MSANADMRVDGWGSSIMKFTLTYDGSLPASGNSSKGAAKWAIRHHFHPQLVDLWANHPALASVPTEFPLGGAVFIAAHHMYPGEVKEPWVPRIVPAGEITKGSLDLAAPIDKHGRLFKPLVRETFALQCGLKVLMLRQEQPGRVYQGGDLDGRVKTLLDALAMPQHKEQVDGDPKPPDLIHCLLEDDSLVSGLNVETERLWGGEQPRDYVKAIIEVDVRVRFGTVYNQSFR